MYHELISICGILILLNRKSLNVILSCWRVRGANWKHPIALDNYVEMQKEKKY